MESQSVEDYLKAIYELQRLDGIAGTMKLAEQLGIAAPSVSGMLRKLAERQLIEHQPYRGVVLTERGQQIALAVIRRHRLAELYLAQALGISWDRVHAEADKWEHILSDDVEQRIDAQLGHPTVDPHGAPIPGRDGTVSQSHRQRLTAVQPGHTVVVVEVSDHDAELLRYLGQLGLYPGTQVEVITTRPLDELITIRVGYAEHMLGPRIAGHVWVADTDHPTGD